MVNSANVIEKGTLKNGLGAILWCKLSTLLGELVIV